MPKFLLAVPASIGSAAGAGGGRGLALQVALPHAAPSLLCGLPVLLWLFLSGGAVQGPFSAPETLPCSAPESCPQTESCRFISA